MEHNEEEINILKEKDFILTSDKNIEYKLKLFINNDSFCISAFTTKNIPSKKYSLSLTMNELIKNRFFKIFINIEEIFREFENKIEKSNLIEDSNIIYLDIPIGLNIINDIMFEIKESQKTNEEIIQELKNELNNKDILIKQKDLKISELEKKLNFHKIEPKLINNINQLELIKSGIKNLDKSKNLKLNLLYRASRDGDKPKAFHDKVDGIAPTISLIQTKETNYIFGGFTDHAWNSKSECTKTNNTFMFSFNKNKIYNGKNGGHICCNENTGPWFCGVSGVIHDNFFKHNKSYQWELETNKKYFEGFTENFELTGGNKNFTVNEVEVFKVEYI